MNQTTTQHSPEEIAEIERHKYFLSEKAGYDVGWQFAEQDWESNHAEEFRRSRGTEKGSSHKTGPVGGFLERLRSKVKAR